MDRVEADLAARRRDRRTPAVVMAHAFVTGGDPSDSERDLRVGGIGDVPAGVFGDAVDYVALGHLHGPQQVRAAVPARYSGSPVAFSFSEKSHIKSSVIVDVSREGVRTEVVPAPVTRRLAELRGTLEEILASPPGDEDAWVKAVVTDTFRPERMRERIVERFPHAIVTLHQPAEAAGDVVGVVPGTTDAYDVLDSFVSEVTGAAPTDRERAILRSAYEASRGTVA